MICIGRQNYFLLISYQTFDSDVQMCCTRYHFVFSTFSLKIKCKICVQKEVIHNFKNHILGTRPATNLPIMPIIPLPIIPLHDFLKIFKKIVQV